MIFGWAAAFFAVQGHTIGAARISPVCRPFPIPLSQRSYSYGFSVVSHGVSDLLFVAILLFAASPPFIFSRSMTGVFIRSVSCGVRLSTLGRPGMPHSLLACGMAAVWRYRTNPGVVAVFVGLLVSFKPVVWPLGLWLLATRRWRTAFGALGVVAGLNLVSWAVIGFGQIVDWWHLLSTQTDVCIDARYGLTAVAVHLGAGRLIATLLQLLVTTAVAVASWRLGRRGREREAFAVA